MQVIVSARHMDLEEEPKALMMEKLRRLTRYYDRIESVEAILDRDGEVPIVEVLVHAEHGVKVVASESGADLYAALDLVIDKVARQLTKHKERLRNRKHQVKRPEQSGEGEC